LLIYHKIFENTKAFIGLLRASKYFLECTLILGQNNLIDSKRNIFKSASNTFFLASLVYLKQQEILPLNQIACACSVQALKVKHDGITQIFE
jgi:hypothetical protein